jgi:uncharacterized protein (DUF4415 family)
MNDDNTKYHVSDGHALTGAEIDRLDEIETRLGDEENIPEIADAAWASAERGKHAKLKQEAISIRLDADVLAWLRAKGPGYRAAISRILRERMLQER